MQNQRQCICTGKPYRAYPWHPTVFLSTIVARAVNACVRNNRVILAIRCFSALCPR